MNTQDPKLENIKIKIKEFQPKWADFYSQHHKSGLSTANFFSDIDNLNSTMIEIIEIITSNVFEKIFIELSLSIKTEIESNINNLKFIINNNIPQENLNNIINYLNNLIKNFHSYGIYFRCKYFKDQNGILENIKSYNERMNNIEILEKRYNVIESQINDLLGDAKIKSIANSFNNATKEIKPIMWFWLVLVFVTLIVLLELHLFSSNIPDVSKFKTENISLFQIEIYTSIIRLSLSIPVAFLIRFCWSQYLFNIDLKTSYILKASVAESTPSILEQLKEKNADETIKEVFKTIYSDNRPTSKNDDDLKEIMIFLKSNNLKELTNLIKEAKK
ncbi:hypothetical protein [Pigmentibacter ruber]|uniref:hypothetical protein n=1 Tax=Pigmentibacter ruber TaxID=2683196 RepID=UPI00131AEA7A|nr:hypothetical protein [Pigmentibacter ruber]